VGVALENFLAFGQRRTANDVDLDQQTAGEIRCSRAKRDGSRSAARSPSRQLGSAAATPSSAVQSRSIPLS